MAGIRTVFHDAEWFYDDGAYVLFDGQFGSTGKGLLASVIAEQCSARIDTVATNAGPNSGHTAYSWWGDGGKVMTQQIPVASVMLRNRGYRVTTYLNGGAIIDPETLKDEIKRYGVGGVIVHPDAAIIKPEHKGDHNSDIASTGKGVGPAMQAKLDRKRDNVAKSVNLSVEVARMSPSSMGRCFVETAQGWSLGINSGFYPHVTSRECSVAQALADLGVSPKTLRKSIVSLRTFPIRVGNHPDGGYSGDVYPDQREISFDELGVEPELTTVTGRVRRVFTWSPTQYAEMLRANMPDAVFINFMNYLPEEERGHFMHSLLADYRRTMGRSPDFILGGYGPKNSDVKVVWHSAVGVKA